jgi:hypothetical protein
MQKVPRLGQSVSAKRALAEPTSDVHPASSSPAGAGTEIAAAATAFSEFLGLSRTIRSLQKHNLTGKRAYVLAAEEGQNDSCENQMNELFELLTTEPAICPTA